MTDDVITRLRALWQEQPHEVTSACLMMRSAARPAGCPECARRDLGPLLLDVVEAAEWLGGPPWGNVSKAMVALTTAMTKELGDA